MLDVWFAGGIVDGGGAFGEDGCHDDVGCAGDAGFIEQHVFACELWGCDVIDIKLAVVFEDGSEFVYAHEMGVEASSSNLVSSWFCHACFVESSEEGTEHENAASEFGASLYELLAAEVVDVEVVRLEFPGVVAHVHDSHSHLAE